MTTADHRSPAEPLSRPLAVAPVSGFPAAVLVGVLAEHLPRVAEQVAAGRIHPDYLTQLREAYAALCEVAAQWRVWRRACAEAEATAAADDSAAALSTAAAEGLREIDTDAAAVVLKVTPNRVRQLCRAGQLPARKVGRTWMVPVGELRQMEVQRSGSV
ncbi:helix-turn-helix domain-containing protein [Micromonospora sp. 4G57]|uniref:Helix-turn-helix domain-containing protein n=1 Tax=Micromonospora sicca TaxID=2202420 RepID=A0ABU5JAS2_9ACTN|nr:MULTISPECIES: helix-turn-helix domain-containing protein [unclassified Micromonospora]MDZ5443797.1 helix-turn-helix domain-containing protein [Micromonospora sp. 4G57]MDZ5489685.1 helix-turn-helix domain-containing protein [Micromonospora sp. 4G53]